MNDGQRNENVNIIDPSFRFISIVAINVHQFIDDSEIYGTIIIMMHFWTSDVDEASEGREFYGATFTRTTCGCKRYLLNNTLFYDSD